MAPLENLSPKIKGFPPSQPGEVAIAATFCEFDQPDRKRSKAHWVLTNFNFYVVASDQVKVSDLRLPQIQSGSMITVPLSEITLLKVVKGRKSLMEFRSESGGTFRIHSKEDGISKLLSTLNKVLLPYYHAQLFEGERNIWVSKPVSVDQNTQDQHLAELANIQSKSIGYINSPRGQKREKDRKIDRVMTMILGIVVAIVWVIIKTVLRENR